VNDYESQLDRLERKQDEILYILNGNGTPGLKTRIDRLERLASGAAWIFGLVGGPAIIAVFVLIVGWLRNEIKTP
jgi:hypothetical protein